MEHLKNDNKKLRMYFLVNKDLKMSPGKVAAQVGHAAIRLYRENEKHKELIEEYLETGETKIVLRASTELLDFLENQGYGVTIRDEGLTEIEHNSLTVNGLILASREEANKIHFWLSSLELY